MIVISLVGRGTKGRDFNNLPPKAHMRQPEAPTNQATVIKELTHLYRRGIGRHIKILRLPTEQQITHTAAHQIALVAAVLESVKNLQSRIGNICPADIVLRPRNYPCRRLIVIVFRLSH